MDWSSRSLCLFGFENKQADFQLLILLWKFYFSTAELDSE